VVRAVAGLVLAAVLLVTTASVGAAQVIMRPGPGANASGVTVLQPAFEPPYRLTVRVYVTAHDGRPLPPPLGAHLMVIDGQGRRAGMDEAGVLHQEIPRSRWEPVRNPEPTAPVGPRGLGGSGVTLDDPADGGYVVEIAGTERVNLEVAVAQWDRAGRRRWLHLSRASTEPGAVDRWDLPYTAAARPAFDLREQPDDSYISIRAYGRRGITAKAITELLLTDARGRRLGREPRTRQTYQEIPRGNYDAGTGDIEGRELEVTRPAPGAYTLDVTGTAAGHYDVTVHVTPRGGQARTPVEILDVPTRPAETHRYLLQNDAVPRIAGALGHGARLLSYAAPTSIRSELAAGETAATLVILYAPAIAPDTFRATLAGRDVSARFGPKPGGWQVVRLPLAPGSSTLVLSVKGATPEGGAVVHTDLLELVRR
jgi:hypothetical protein